MPVEKCRSRKRTPQRRRKRSTATRTDARTARATPVSGPGNVTLRDIGKALGLSHVTVSLALRNSIRIPEKRRLQVQKMARQMGYQPNPMATALAHLRRASGVRPVSAALAWLNFWEQPADLRRHAEFDAYWRGASAAAEKFGYRLDEFVCDGKSLSLERLQRILISRGIQGVLLPPERTKLDLEQFDWSKFSIVRFGRTLEKPQTHLVTSDHVANAMRAFTAAKDLGYKRIAFLDDGSYLRGIRFLAGFMLAQRFAPAGERVPLFSFDENSWRDCLPAFQRWMKHAKPDAIISDFPHTADLLSLVGYRVPDDVGVAAMSILDGHCDAGIDQHPEEIGRVATLLLVSLIHDGDRGEPSIFREILVEGSWVDGSMMPRRP